MKYECRKGRWKLDKKCKKIGENLPIFLYDFPPLFANSIFGISFFEAFPTIELIDFSCAFSIKLVNVAYYHSVLSLTLFSQTGILFVNVIHTYFTFFTFISNTYLKWLKKVSKSIKCAIPHEIVNLHRDCRDRSTVRTVNDVWKCISENTPQGSTAT